MNFYNQRNHVINYSFDVFHNGIYKQLDLQI